MKKILLVILIVLVISLSACNKNKVASTQSIVCLNGELYSVEGKNGLIVNAVISYYDLEVKREKITCYGFAYVFSCPGDVDEIILGKDGIYEVTVEDVDSGNNINCVITIPEEHYNTDMAFRPFLKYLDENGEEQILYSYDYDAANLYDLAKKIECEFATEVVNYVENNK